LEKNNISICGLESQNKSQLKITNEDVLKSFLSPTVYSAPEALEDVLAPRPPSIRPTPLFKGPLIFGDITQPDRSININIVIYHKTMEAKLPSAKKYSKISDTMDSTDYKTHEVNMTREYKVVQTDYDDDHDDMDGLGDHHDGMALVEGKTVDEESTVKAYKYGKTLIPMSKLEEETQRFRTEKGMWILGVMEQSLVR